MHGLRDKVKHLEKCLMEYKHFEGSDYNIHKCLELVSSFFQNQGKSQGASQQMQGITSFLPLGE